MSQSKHNRTIRGQEHQLVLLRITAWDAHGRPSAAEIGHDDTTFDLSENQLNNHFITAYVRADQIKKVTRQ